jgi:hypothetical protein
MTTLDEIEARLNAATPGPWAVRWENGPEGSFRVVSTPDDAWFVQDVSEGDATFIAHAPGDIRTLLGMVRELTRKRDLSSTVVVHRAFHAECLERVSELHELNEICKKHHQPGCLVFTPKILIEHLIITAKTAGIEANYARDQANARAESAEAKLAEVTRERDAALYEVKTVRLAIDEAGVGETIRQWRDIGLRAMRAETFVDAIKAAVDTTVENGAYPDSTHAEAVTFLREAAGDELGEDVDAFLYAVEGALRAHALTAKGGEHG